MNVFYEPFDTKLVMLSNIMQYLKNGLFSKCFHKVFVKNMMKKLSHLNTKFQDSFQHVCIIAPSCVLYLKFYVFFCYCHHSLFNVSLLYLFINVFTRYLLKNFNIQFNMYVSLHHHMFLCLTFMYLSIPSSLIVEGTANTW